MGLALPTPAVARVFCALFLKKRCFLVAEFFHDFAVIAFDALGLGFCEFGLPLVGLTCAEEGGGGGGGVGGVAVALFLGGQRGEGAEGDGAVEARGVGCFA